MLLPDNCEKVPKADFQREKRDLCREGPEFTILTRPPAENIAFLHDRMPVILPEVLLPHWLDPRRPGQPLLQQAVTDVIFTPAEAG